MNVELLVIPDCPHVRASEAILRTALDRAGHPDLPVTTVVVHTEEQAATLGFVGSPSIHVDGHEVLPEHNAPAAWACRVYTGPDGRQRGVPDETVLSEALRRWLPVTTAPDVTRPNTL